MRNPWSKRDGTARMPLKPCTSRRVSVRSTGNMHGDWKVLRGTTSIPTRIRCVADARCSWKDTPGAQVYPGRSQAGWRGFDRKSWAPMAKTTLGGRSMGVMRPTRHLRGKPVDQSIRFFSVPTERAQLFSGGRQAGAGGCVSTTEDTLDFTQNAFQKAGEK